MIKCDWHPTVVYGGAKGYHLLAYRESPYRYVNGYLEEARTYTDLPIDIHDQRPVRSAQNGQNVLVVQATEAFAFPSGALEGNPASQAWALPWSLDEAEYWFSLPAWLGESEGYDWFARGEVEHVAKVFALSSPEGSNRGPTVQSGIGREALPYVERCLRDPCRPEVRYRAFTWLEGAGDGRMRDVWERYRGNPEFKAYFLALLEDPRYARHLEQFCKQCWPNEFAPHFLIGLGKFLEGPSYPGDYADALKTRHRLSMPAAERDTIEAARALDKLIRSEAATEDIEAAQRALVASNDPELAVVETVLSVRSLWRDDTKASQRFLWLQTLDRFPIEVRDPIFVNLINRSFGNLDDLEAIRKNVNRPGVQ